MLVLTRLLNEKIIINDNIVVTIVNIMGNKVRLGIEAPDDVGIWRSEIYQDIKNANNRKGDATIS